MWIYVAGKRFNVEATHSKNVNGAVKITVQTTDEGWFLVTYPAKGNKQPKTYIVRNADKARKMWKEA